MSASIASVSPSCLNDIAAARAEIRAAAIPMIVTGALILRQEKVLVLRRSKGGFLGGNWDIPGGKVRADESIVEGLQREVMEETGLRISSVDSLFGTFDFVDAVGRMSRQLNFFVQADQAAIRLNRREHDAFDWVGRNELSSLRPNVSDETLNTLKEALRVSGR